MNMPYGQPNTGGMMGGGGVMPTLDPMKRAQMAQALAGSGAAGPWAPMVQAMAMRQQQANKPQMISPGTAANGGWTTTMEPSGQGGLLSRLQTMFGAGGA